MFDNENASSLIKKKLIRSPFASIYIERIDESEVPCLYSFYEPFSPLNLSFFSFYKFMTNY